MSEYSVKLGTFARDGNAVVLEMLLSREVDLDATTLDNATALFWAARSGHGRCVQLLVGAGADVNKGNVVDGNTPLGAAANSSVAGVLLAAEGVIVDKPNNEGSTPLHLAAEEGRYEVVKKLIDAGAQMDVLSKAGRTPLEVAVEKNRPKCAKRIRKAMATKSVPIKATKLLGIAAMEGRADELVKLISILKPEQDCNTLDFADATPVYLAARRGNVVCLKELIAAGADVDMGDIAGQPPISTAAGNGHFECVEMLIRAGAKVNLTSTSGLSALHMAAFYNHQSIIKLLLANGADPTRADPTLADRNHKTTAAGRTPLDCALKDGHEDCARLLRTAMDDHKGPSQALVDAASIGDINTIRELLDMGIDVNSRDRIHFATPLFSAVQAGHLACVKFLLDHGADVDLPTINGDTPLLCAAHDGKADIVALLVHKAHVNTANNNGVTALHYASFYGHLHVTRMLLQTGADTTISCNEGKTAYAWAAVRGQDACMRLIVMAEDERRVRLRQMEEEHWRRTQNSNALTPPGNGSLLSSSSVGRRKRKRAFRVN